MKKREIPLKSSGDVITIRFETRVEKPGDKLFMHDEKVKDVA